MTTEIKPLAVITGGSSGIGFELGRQFAEHGYDLVIAAEDRGHLEEAAQALRGLGGQGSDVQVVAGDLATFEGVQALYDAVKQTGRPIDVLCVNAGVGVGGDFARETDLQAELKMIQLNVTSAVHLTKLVVKDMVARDQGRILFTSSVAGMMPGPREAVYAASKAFIRFFSAALDNELQDTNVVITALMPGPTETNFFHRAGLDDTKVGQSDMKSDPADVAKEAFQALMKGKDHVVAGAMNKVQTGMGALMPDSARTAMHGQMTKPAE